VHTDRPGTPGAVRYTSVDPAGWDDRGGPPDRPGAGWLQAAPPPSAPRR